MRINVNNKRPTEIQEDSDQTPPQAPTSCQQKKYEIKKLQVELAYKAVVLSHLTCKTGLLTFRSPVQVVRFHLFLLFFFWCQENVDEANKTCPPIKYPGR